jgi:ubiquinone/menaquinone biosynthesis C-methylase UbiE
MAATFSPYDEIADWYNEWVGTGSMSEDPFFRVVEDLMGEVAGLHICDLACGQGRAARHLADSGARVTGVDLSAKLLAIAHRHEAARPRGIGYVRADAANLESLKDRIFDGVLSHMALMDIPDLASTLNGAARILKPGGWFVFSILHPCFNTARSDEVSTPEGWIRTVAGYFDEGYWRSASRTGPPGKVGAHHRTLTTYVDLLLDAGFTLERVREPRFTGEDAEGRPIWAEVPAALIVHCRRNEPGGVGR